jgi:two-component system cell cycle response regulator
MKVMIVEDDPVSRRILENFLKEWGYEVLSTPDGVEAWEIMQQAEAPSLVISDWMMPAMEGPELCEKIRGMDRTDYTYFILLTAKGDKKDIIEGLESGADDFIVKPFNRQELRSRIKIGERIINLERRIIQMANTDFLTGVLNRRAFMQRMASELNRSRRENEVFSVILMDIDHFKKINDNYGHQTGDRVLERLACELSKNIRSYDFVGRYGGEEFIMCLPDTGTELCVQIAERMRVKIEELRVSPPGDKGAPLHVTASFGVASFLLETEMGVDPVIKRADDALYTAKSEGRNRVCVYQNVSSKTENPPESSNEKAG